MKIKKLIESKILEADEESVTLGTDKPVEAETVVTELGEKPQDTLDLDTASQKKIVADMAQGAEEADTGINPAEAKKEADVVEKVAGLIRNPYGTARPDKIKRTLQRSLDTILDQKDVGLGTKNFPNVIIYGLAGFGKTSIVQEFCKEHNLNLFECDAKNLDPATVGGIPYPKTNSKTGEITQSPISSEYWGGLEEPNTILFLDEINRANGRTRGSLLTLINEHKLPASIKDPVTGKFSATKYFPNILFSVIAINPADDVFEDNEPLDPAMISRHGVVIRQDPDIQEFLGHLTKIYTGLENNQYLDPALKAKYAGQFNIAKELLSPKSGFSFDSADEVRHIYQHQGDQIGNYLNYRSFLLTLLRSNGTKKDYLDVIEDESGFSPAKIAMIKNILATYTDKVTTGNNVFTKNTTHVTPQRAAKAAAKVEQDLDDFMGKLNN